MQNTDTEQSASTATLRLVVDADALAASIREASERTIRAHAYRLVAERRDALRTMTADERRAELLALAEKVANEELHADALAMAALPYLTDVSNAAHGLEVLVAAVRERDRFTTDPDQWLLAHDLSLDVRVWERMDESTLADVDEALDALIGVQR